MAKKESAQPDKKRKVAKKTTARSAKKVPAKKSAKKTARKTPTKKATKKKAVTQKLTKKRESKSERSSREVALEHLFKKTTEEPVTPQKEETNLPSHMSPRAIEKAQAIKLLLSDRVAVRVGGFAYVLSFAFILIGGLYSASYVAGNFEPTDTQLANVLNSGAGSTVQNATNDVTQSIAPSTLAVDSNLPRILENEFELRFTVTDAVKVDTVLRNSDTGMRFQLPTDEVGQGRYLLLIPNGLAPGNYTIQVTAEGLDGAKYDFKAGSFTVPEPVAQTASNDDLDDVVDTTVATTNLPSDDESDEEDDAAVTANTVPLSPAAPVPAIRNEFSLFLSTTTLAVPQMLIMQAPRDVTDLTVYIVKRNGFTKQLLGAAKQEFGTWRMFIDVTNIPNGQYELFAEGEVNDVIVESSRQQIQIQKRPQTIPPTVEVPDEAAEIEDATEVLPPERSFSELSLTPERSTDPESEAIVTDLLRENKTDLEILLRNYSVAAQTNDVLAKRLASDAINRKQAELQEAGELATPRIKDELSERLRSLQDRIDTFEELRRSRSDDETALDTDQDGISDIDETTLFRTDPTNPDTDGDGILDSVEIMRGFNPRLAASETAVLFESPRSTEGLEQPEVLRITNVVPEVQEDEEDEERDVLATISGFGLPNSYVTLFVFSVPTIVTVKTDDTGAFSYTFAKELEDGTHEVFVAITDNTGEIVAQSEGFTFTKRAEAFTVGAATTPSAPAGTPASQTPYELGLGLGVLALGIILLMLGIGLRQPQEAVVT